MNWAHFPISFHIFFSNLEPSSDAEASKSWLILKKQSKIKFLDGRLLGDLTIIGWPECSKNNNNWEKVKYVLLPGKLCDQSHQESNLISANLFYYILEAGCTQMFSIALLSLLYSLFLPFSLLFLEAFKKNALKISLTYGVNLF